MDDDFEAYYDGELALGPFLRVWARDRWRRLRAFVKYRVLRRKRPVLPRGSGGCASLATLQDMYKKVYGPQFVATIAEGHPFLAMVSGKPVPPPVVRVRVAPGPNDIPDHEDNTGCQCRNVGLPLTLANVMHDCCGWCHDREAELWP